LHLSRKQLSELQQDIASQKLDCQLITIKYPLSGSIATNLSPSEQEKLVQNLDLQNDDLLFMCVGQRWDHVLNCLGRVRLMVAKLMQQASLLEIPSDKYNFMWVVDFPLFERVLEGQAGIAKGHEGLASMHHPFTAPHPDDVEKIATDPEKVRGLHYDVVLNGMELGGGSIRIHNAQMQRYVLEELLQLGKERTEERFSHLLEALSYGAPPHGGIALGFDRVVSVLCGKHAQSLRDVIAFPKSSAGNELMSGSPGNVEESQLRELHLAIQQ
jgi:aspartyl-tRNA synthetase